MKIIQNLCITAAMGIFAMNANSAFGFTDEEFEGLKKDSGTWFERSDKGEFSLETMGCITHNLCGCREGDKPDVVATFHLLCLNCNPKELKDLSPAKRISLSNDLKSGKFDACREDLEKLSKSSEKLELVMQDFNVSSLVPKRKRFDVSPLVSERKKFGATLKTFLIQSTHINKLNLKNCDGLRQLLTHDGYLCDTSKITALAEALKVNKSLVCLDLSNNKIGYSEATALAEALEVNECLTHLDLSNNGIGRSEVPALAEALKVNDHLICLNLRDNEGGDVGATALAEALKVNKSLVYLNLVKNEIGDDGATALAEALKVNNHLTYLESVYTSWCYKSKPIHSAGEMNESDK